MPLPSLSRRHFIKTSALAASALGFPFIARSQSPNSEIRVGIIGFNGRGQSHISDLLKINGVKITGLCDVDAAVLGKAKDSLSKTGQTISTFTDARKMLDSKEIDAISTATPNHWHSLIGIWACQAGKDAYVESPSRTTSAKVVCSRRRRENTGASCSAARRAVRASASSRR